MNPMLHCLPERRATAQEMLSHLWLNQKTDEKKEKMSSEEHEKIKKDKYQLDEPRE